MTLTKLLYLFFLAIPCSCATPWRTFVAPHSPNRSADDAPLLTAALTEGQILSNATILFQKGVTYNIFSPVKFPVLQNVEVAIEGNITYPTDIATIQGMPPTYPGAWFAFSGGENVTLRGSSDPQWGWVDAHGQAWWDTQQQTNRPHGWAFSNIQGGVIQDMKLWKPIGWNFATSGSSNLHIFNNKIVAVSDTTSFPFNTDGKYRVSPEAANISHHATGFSAGGTNLLFENNHVQNGDDCLTVGNGAKNILWRSSYCEGGHGLSIGSLGEDGQVADVENIFIESTVMNNTLYAARFKSWTGGNGFARNVTWKDITFHSVPFPIYVTQNYWDQEDGPKPNSTSLNNTHVEDFLFDGFTGTIEDKPFVEGSCVTDPCWYAVPGATGKEVIILDLYPGTGADSPSMNGATSAVDRVATDTTRTLSTNPHIVLADVRMALESPYFLYLPRATHDLVIIDHGLPNIRAIANWPVWTRPPPGSPSNPCYRISEAPKKGLGMFARRAIKRGELIAQERPVYASTGALRVLDDQGSLTGAFWKRVSAGRKPLRGTLATNFLQIDMSPEPDPTVTYVGCFPVLSRANHACTPCANYFFSFTNFTGQLWALRDIAEGEEITISYCDLAEPKETRQTYLRDQFFFDCTCATCSLPNEEAKQSDARRRMLKSLLQPLERIELSVTRQQLDAGLAWAQEEHLPVHHAQILFYGSTLLTLKGTNPSVIRNWMQRARALYVIFVFLISITLNGVHGALRWQEEAAPSQYLLTEPLASEWKLDSPGNVETLYDVARDPAFQNYQLRITKPRLCDPSVTQYSGYLDISEARHLFFWFFESRNSPEDAPLMLWLNGGPGGSTIAAGLLFEHGPCSVAPDGNRTIRNDYAWNEKVNIIYLDQPIGTGYSYATDGTTVNRLEDVAIDVYAFLQIFLHRFPQYAHLPFHIAAESWGGHYAPHIAHHIFTQNRYYQAEKVAINLASVILANGLTEPASQFEMVPQYVCMDAPYPIRDWDDPQCVAMRAALPSCVQAIHACYRAPTWTAVCNAATVYCWPTYVSFPILNTGKNPYDIREECNITETTLCYPEFDPISRWLNRTETKVALGVDPAYDFQVINNTVAESFYYQGQAMLNSASLLPGLINSGVRVLAYAGNTDAVCNHMGIELWMTRLEHWYHEEFESTLSIPWMLESGFHVGMVHAAGPGAGNVTFVQIFDAGHMAPHDQPQATLDMISRWVDNVPVAQLPWNSRPQDTLSSSQSRSQ
ncbi:hypothetical protein NM688_g2075 [Phlebia brevispora]|uniref:Uncharacterized protein n=1 Tax=Phlebia brevispora TaxID=194682 RepID=A0ACC1T9W0_9APHY|nr:hypothetical protein NM688_g2075 [Phlebia brevispora]